MVPGEYLHPFGWPVAVAAKPASPVRQTDRERRSVGEIINFTFNDRLPSVVVL